MCGFLARELFFRAVRISIAAAAGSIRRRRLRGFQPAPLSKERQQKGP
jgi:hypothetical protein